MRKSLFDYSNQRQAAFRFRARAGSFVDCAASLQGAQAAFARGNIKSGDNQLNAFINQVNAQSGKSLTPAQAAVLIR
jgi:hypothetical protein